MRSNRQSQDAVCRQEKMKTATFDLNNFVETADPSLVDEVMKVVSAAPLHVKASDQAGKQGRLIFDPVGSNEYFKNELVLRKWSSRVPIPNAQQALGIDVDFGKGSHLLEVQFSNYPFFLNNIIRTNVLFTTGTVLKTMGAIRAAVIITKAKLFEASNSTLYYEQAVEQAQFLVAGKTVTVPLRLIGLMADRDSIVDAVLTHYHAPRYSRTVVQQEQIKIRVGGDKSIRQLERPLLTRV